MTLLGWHEFQLTTDALKHKTKPKFSNGKGNSFLYLKPINKIYKLKDLGKTHNFYLHMKWKIVYLYNKIQVFKVCN